MKKDFSAIIFLSLFCLTNSFELRAMDEDPSGQDASEQDIQSKIRTLKEIAEAQSLSQQESSKKLSFLKFLGEIKNICDSCSKDLKYARKFFAFQPQSLQNLKQTARQFDQEYGTTIETLLTDIFEEKEPEQEEAFGGRRRKTPPIPIPGRK